MKITYLITILALITATVVGLIILNDKQSVEPVVDNNISTTSVKTVAELSPMPEGFREVVLDSGLRFGVPEEWNSSNTNSDEHYSYATDDYFQETVTKRIGEGVENDFLVRRGYWLSVEFSGKEINDNYREYFENLYTSRCTSATDREKCFAINSYNNWYIYKMNANFPSQNIQYIYIAGKIIDNKAVSFSLYPPHDIDLMEGEKLFTQILETVAVVESR